MSIKGKLILAFAIVAFLATVVSCLIVGIMGASVSKQALSEEVKSKLVSVRDSQRSKIQSYIKQILDQTKTLADSRMTMNAMAKLSASFKYYGEDIDADSSLKAKLSSYYTDEFEKEYKALNNGDKIAAIDFLNQLTPNQIAIQYAYIKANPNALGEKDKLVKSSNGTAYDDTHAVYHKHYRNILQTFSFYDIFLVDAHSGEIVYSVFKELDFGTSLKNGPYANTGIGEAFKKANVLPKGETVVIDFSPYPPSYDGAAAFFASPIFDASGKKRLGVLIFQAPVDVINDVMTFSGKWRNFGFGDSGETYLVGPDNKMRSISRFLAEDPKKYQRIMKKSGMDPEEVQLILAKGTTLGLQKVGTQGAKAALAGKAGFGEFLDYRNVPVLSAYAPLDIPGLNWGILSEVDVKEALKDSDALQSKIMYVGIIVAITVLIVATIIAYVIADMLSKPIKKLSQFINEVGNQRDLTLEVTIHQKDEIGAMASAIRSLFGQFREFFMTTNSSASEMEGSSKDLSSLITNTTGVIENQKAEADNVVSSMSKVAASAKEVADNTVKSSEVVERARNNSKNGHEVVTQTVLTINTLSSEVDKSVEVINELHTHGAEIDSILGVIRGIAEQTNLLALNAAIEAARAGEQGRGFAVVADEVRSLAQRTQQATVEIQDKIERLQHGTEAATSTMEAQKSQMERSVELASKAGKSLEEISEDIKLIYEVNQKIAVSAQEQQKMTDSMNRRVENISKLTEEVLDSAQSTSVSSDRVAEISTNLKQLTEQFKV
ncbi:methyl-accepting chemotaxis protein [Piscirickettsia salmonis]|uniref:methyl-accepting chemotaxis protein n=1 Tax=Piscirickettsia salmonis TaxID=1238 RepID=UPI0007C990E9|nr:Methyl-accepting chemotaxis protein PctB [Piscirickettsiaceae bacterium NZ-RLO1]